MLMHHTAENAIEMAHVRKYYHGQAVLDGITLRIGAGQVVSLIGPSGCGKSTLLRLLAHLDHDYEGSIHCPRTALSMVFQSPRLLPWATVLDNVRFVLHGKGETSDVGSDAGARQAIRALQDVGLGDSLALYPDQLSGGMQQRVALARALVPKPQIVLFDEPLASLDYLTKLEMLDLLTTLVEQQRITAVYVTHDVREAVALSDRIVVLSPRPARIIRIFTHPHPRSHHYSSDHYQLEQDVVECVGGLPVSR
jgi:NitT/TauT family transport system ATP-binding protein